MRILEWQKSDKSVILECEAVVQVKGAIFKIYRIYKDKLRNEYILQDKTFSEVEQCNVKTHVYHTLDLAKEKAQKLYEEFQVDIIKYFS